MERPQNQPPSHERHIELARGVGPAALARFRAYLDSNESPLYVPQLESLRRIYELWSENPTAKGFVDAATSAGKTPMIVELARVLELRTLVLTPRTEHVGYIRDEFIKFGTDTSAVSAIKPESSHKAFAAQHLVMTNSLFTYRTKNGQLNPEYFDLVILDEAHTAMGEQTTQALRIFGALPQLGFTATTKYSRYRRLDSLLPNEIDKISIEEMIDAKKTAPFINLVLPTEMDASSVRLRSGDYDPEDIQQFANTLRRNQMIVNVYKRHFDGKKTIVNCGGVAHATDIAKLFNENGIHSVPLHHELSLFEQNCYLDALKDPSNNTIKVFCNVQIASVGTNAPGVEVVINAVPTASTLRAKQRGGRAGRINPHNPQKVSIILEVVDSNYISPPALYADPEVIGKATYGCSPEQLAKYALENLMSVPSDVEALARAFSEMREEYINIAERAPAGSVLRRDIVPHLHGMDFETVVKRLKKDDPDFYEANVTIPGQRLIYYTQALVLRLVALSQEMKRGHAAPTSWFATSQIDAIYGAGTSKKLKQLIETLPNKDSYIGTFESRKIPYVSSAAVQLFAPQLGIEYVDTQYTAPPGWKGETALEQEYSPLTFSATLAFLHERFERRMFNSTIDANGETHYGKDAQKLIEMFTTHIPSSWQPVNNIRRQVLLTDAQFSQLVDEVSELHFDYARPLHLDGGDAWYLSPYTYPDVVMRAQRLAQQPRNFK